MIFRGVRAVQAAWTVEGLREKLHEREEYPGEATTISLRLSGREESQAGVKKKMLIFGQKLGIFTPFSLFYEKNNDL